MDIDTLFARAETLKKLKKKIDKMKLGCVCDFKAIGEDEITIVLNFNQNAPNDTHKVITGFAGQSNAI